MDREKREYLDEKNDERGDMTKADGDWIRQEDNWM